MLPVERRRVELQVVVFHALLEKRDAKCIVWLFLESQLTAVSNILVELLGIPTAQFLEWDLQLLLLDVLVLLILILAGKALPWETASDEVQQDVAYGF